MCSVHLDGRQSYDIKKVGKYPLTVGREDANMGSHGKQTEVDELRRELEALWARYHAERCDEEWPHDGPCLLPRPRILDGVFISMRVDRESAGGCGQPH
jgi:hypothetical protein